ncbi:hypothetical protein OUZ56_014379 [Daphnia magna]|uniref:Uncharacterized protein n=1 Tax=Daphnia magna TaxID=35525 RepID=A0ABR0AJL0_9CRUS|nr:hypothetical protein OUZ56_014379 [Daphnia magna]
MVVGGSMSVTIPGKALVAAAQAHVLETRRSHEQLRRLRMAVKMDVSSIEIYLQTTVCLKLKTPNVPLLRKSRNKTPKAELRFCI